MDRSPLRAVRQRGPDHQSSEGQLGRRRRFEYSCERDQASAMSDDIDFCQRWVKRFVICEIPCPGSRAPIDKPYR